MVVLQQQASGVLSATADAIPLESQASGDCCCGEFNTPARLCSSGDIYRYHPFGDVEGDVCIAGCVVGTFYMKGFVFNGFELEPTPCLYIDPADCRPIDDTDIPLFGGTTYGGCAECEAASP